MAICISALPMCACLPKTCCWAKGAASRSPKGGLDRAAFTTGANFDHISNARMQIEQVRLLCLKGISQDTPLARQWAHLRTLRLADGPDAVHRRQVARAELRTYTQEKM